MGKWKNFSVQKLRTLKMGLEVFETWVIYNENRDYLKCNDLSWDGKTKCD